MEVEITIERRDGTDKDIFERYTMNVSGGGWTQTRMNDRAIVDFLPSQVGPVTRGRVWQDLVDKISGRVLEVIQDVQLCSDSYAEPEVNDS